MAYNREWDRGKDNWNDNSWGYDSRGSSHGGNRDDDCYGEGKRRKYNNGNYDSAQAYDDNSAYYHKNEPQDYGQDQRQGSFPKKRLVPSEPSPHVIFLGLDPDFTEADLQAYLTSQSCSIETVTIIRDRTSGSSKGFGFAQFTTVDHARAFVDPLFPFIQVPPPASHGASATTAFYKALETGAPHNGRRVKIDYSQSASHHDRRFNRANANDGTRDIGNSQAPVLLFRGLDPLSGPQAIYQAMLYSSGPNKQGAKGMKRIILIKDKVTMASFGFAFVEFVDIPSASAVLAATMSPQVHPNGFRISDRPVAASFAHPYSFQPVTEFLSRDDACIPSSLNLGGVEGTWVRYWDEHATVAVLEFRVEEPTPSLSSAAASAKDKEKERKKKTKLNGEVPKDPLVPSTLPVSDKPVTLSFSKGPLRLNAGPVKPALISMDDGSNNELPDSTEEPTTNPSKAHQVKKVAPLIASKKTFNNINKWNQIQEDLSHEGESSTTLAASVPVPTVTAKTASTPPPESEPEFEFADVSTLMCVLCARQFKTLDVLKRHNKESDLHKKNYKDANLREVAKAKLQARKSATEQPKYRDRASERRTLFNQPETPLPEKESNSKPAKKRFTDGPPPPLSPPPPVLNPGEDSSNVGNKLLKMMGWTEGMGLGTDEDGRREPIITAIYAQGVGLGAAKGREIGKFSEGYSGYVQQAQEAARERYGN